jgi:hypothetical protein
MLALLSLATPVRGVKNMSSSREFVNDTSVELDVLHKTATITWAQLATDPALQPPLLSVTPLRTHTNWSRQPLVDFDESVRVVDDADVVSLHEDAAFGIPWEHYLSGGSVPKPAFWSEHVARLKAGTAPGGPWHCAQGVFLSLTLVQHGGGRSCPAGNASSAGNANAPFVGPTTGVCSSCCSTTADRTRDLLPALTLGHICIPLRSVRGARR